MKSRAMTPPLSSLNTASFRLVLLRTARGLVYRLRREVKTMKRLYADSFLDVVNSARCGRVRTSANIRTLHSK